MTKASVHRKQGLKIQKQEAKIQEAVDGVKNGKYKSCALAARELGIEPSYTTIWR
jgi:hypothetical protein